MLSLIYDTLEVSTCRYCGVIIHGHRSILDDSIYWVHCDASTGLEYGPMCYPTTEAMPLTNWKLS